MPRCLQQAWACSKLRRRLAPVDHGICNFNPIHSPKTQRRLHHQQTVEERRAPGNHRYQICKRPKIDDYVCRRASINERDQPGSDHPEAAKLRDRQLYRDRDRP